MINLKYNESLIKACREITSKKNMDNLANMIVEGRNINSKFDDMLNSITSSEDMASESFISKD